MQLALEAPGDGLKGEDLPAVVALDERRARGGDGDVPADRHEAVEETMELRGQAHRPLEEGDLEALEANPRFGMRRDRSPASWHEDAAGPEPSRRQVHGHRGSSGAPVVDAASFEPEADESLERK